MWVRYWPFEYHHGQVISGNMVDSRMRDMHVDEDTKRSYNSEDELERGKWLEKRRAMLKYDYYQEPI